MPQTAASTCVPLAQHSASAALQLPAPAGVQHVPGLPVRQLPPALPLAQSATVAVEPPGLAASVSPSGRLR